MLEKKNFLSEEEYLQESEEALKALKQDFLTIKAYITQTDKRQKEMIHIFENRFNKNISILSSLIKDLANKI